MFLARLPCPCPTLLVPSTLDLSRNLTFNRKFRLPDKELAWRLRPLREHVSDALPQVPATLSAADRERLLAAAAAMFQRAYAPYSKFLVGAAVLTEAGNLYSGCNVENASYGLTNCAERTAIFSAIAAEGPSMRLRAVAALNAQEAICSPCGACRQVIFEFGPRAIVLFRGTNGILEMAAKDLLPAGFSL